MLLGAIKNYYLWNGMFNCTIVITGVIQICKHMCLEGKIFKNLGNLMFTVQ